ncbi:MAG TPA: DUF6458 family protein [Micromonosporaceae bacterium]|jgi:hypothetical protein|nr:DUF6458 family protein [Micromonosporaceae bacterium]
MGIGASVFLIAVGAILAFAVRDTTLGGWIDINVAGWVLVLAGAIGLIMTLIMWGRRRSQIMVDRPIDTGYERRVVDEDRI